RSMRKRRRDVLDVRILGVFDVTNQDLIVLKIVNQVSVTQGRVTNNGQGRLRGKHTREETTAREVGGGNHQLLKGNQNFGAIEVKLHSQGVITGTLQVVKVGALQLHLERRQQPLEQQRG